MCSRLLLDAIKMATPNNRDDYRCDLTEVVKVVDFLQKLYPTIDLAPLKK